MENLNLELTDNEQFISPECSLIQYSGRIDFSNKTSPLFIYPLSSIQIKFTGTILKIVVKNFHNCWNNYLGFILDEKQEKILLSNENNLTTITIAKDLEDKEHTFTLFKRMDGCHYFSFHGIILSKDAKLIQLNEKPQRKIEFFGDSVTAGEVSEALDYVGKPDPEHNGEFSNSWYAYSAITARKLNAQIHDIAQGGISLLNDTGYFNAPNYIGIENTYDKLKYNPCLGEVTNWDFSLYTPHVVVIAIGQNDSNPHDYMKEDYNCKKAIYWREHYKAFVENIHKKYPNATIILATTILEHDKNWDKSIDEVCNEINNPKIHHFLYKRNGCGTPGHIRIPEAKEMAEELSNFIISLGDDIWR